MNQGIEAELERETPLALDVCEEAIAFTIRSAADRRQGDELALLKLLRLLEALHREIREGLFQESLPNNRQALYALLKDIEAEGGWPYINRMRLQSLLERLQPACNLAEPAAPIESIE